MEQFRCGVAVLLVVAVPAQVVFWVVVHPFAGFWHRAGSWRGHVAGMSLSVTVAVFCFRARGWIRPH